MYLCQEIPSSRDTESMKSDKDMTAAHRTISLLTACRISARMRARPALGFWDYSHKHWIDLCTFNIVTSACSMWVRHFTYRSNFQILRCSNSQKSYFSRYYFLPFCVKLCFRSLFPNLLERHWLGSHSSEWRTQLETGKHPRQKSLMQNGSFKHTLGKQDNADGLKWQEVHGGKSGGKKKKPKNEKKQKERGIEIQFLAPISLPAADHLLPGCLRWWAQKHSAWKAKVTPALGRRVGNR